MFIYIYKGKIRVIILFGRYRILRKIFRGDKKKTTTNKYLVEKNKKKDCVSPKTRSHCRNRIWTVANMNVWEITQRDREKKTRDVTIIPLLCEYVCVSIRECARVLGWPSWEFIDVRNRNSMGLKYGFIDPLLIYRYIYMSVCVSGP